MGHEDDGNHQPLRLEQELSAAASAGQAREAGAALEAWGVSDSHSLPDAIVSESLPNDVRAWACWAAGQLRLGIGLASLLDVMRTSTDRGLLYEAAKAISLIGGTQAADELVSLLGQRRVTSSLAAAVWALGAMEAHGAVDAIGALLADPASDVELREHAAEALGRLHADELGPRLLSCLEDRAPEVRFSAAYALGMIGYTAALGKLSELASADVSTIPDGRVVADEARWAIQQIRQSAPE